MNISDWKKRVDLIRAEKDKFFKYHPQSPLAITARQKFQGLNYYPPDPDYRFELPLHKHERTETLITEDTQGNERELLKWGEFRFKIKAKKCILQAYKNSPAEERLFLPFRDVTSGKETYGAGRYLDLTPEHHKTPRGYWILDFNQAYNPWCAYSERYACPFVNPENWLQVEIRAGEKDCP